MLTHATPNSEWKASGGGDDGIDLATGDAFDMEVLP